MELVIRDKSKIQSISIMRVIAMFMIVFFHSFYFYTKNWWVLGGIVINKWDKVATFLDIIDLPMFMYISGYLFGYLFLHKEKYRDTKAFITSKFKRLILPYLFWGIFQIMVLPSIFGWKSIFTGSGHLWFLLVLFEIFVVVIFSANYLCCQISVRIFEQYIMAFVVVFFLFHFISGHHSFLCIHSFFYYLPSFMIGIYSARFRFLQLFTCKSSLIVMLVSLVVLGCFILNYSNCNFIVDYICRLVIGLTIVVSIHALLNTIVIPDANRLYLVVSHFDKFSLGIYIFHQIVINIFLSIDGVDAFLNIHFNIGPFVIFTVGFLGAWFLSYLFFYNKLLKWTIG